MAANDPFEKLREAIRQSPDNILIRQHLAEMLLERGLFAEAELEYRQALSRDSGNLELRLGLARAFSQQGKTSEALVVLEELLKRRDAPAEAHLLHAQLLLKQGDIPAAVAHYKLAISEDPDLADEDLAAQLGVLPADVPESASEVVDGRMRASHEPPETSSVEVERPKIDFTSVGGMEALKEEIRLKIIYPLQHKELYAAYGKSIGGGLLMYGPPGCGKTHLARATAGEIKAGFLAVGISDVLDMWIGNSERNLHSIFDRARRSAPCVLFFDEVDALGAKRSDMRTSGGRHLINQFLSEFDGASASNEGVLILAATNAPWHLDPAFRRPGRFDRVLFVPPPDAAARAGILQILCRGKPAEEIDFDQVAKKTDNFSGADLKGLVDRAVEAKLQEAMKSGVPKPLGTRDLIQAAKAQRTTCSEWFATARNHALFSNEGGVYDDILKYLKM